MDSAEQIRQAMLRHHGLRVGTHMARYLQTKLASPLPHDGSIPIIGADARTGIAIRQLLSQAQLRQTLGEVGNA